MATPRPVSSMNSALKADLSYLPNFNDVGIDVPLEAKIHPGQVLFVSDKLKPDTSGEARTNAVRPSERLGTRGGFSPGVKIFSGGASRNIPIATNIDPGQVLFVLIILEPDTSGEARTNAVRPSESLGSRESFTRGVRHWMGAVPRNIPVKPEISHGKVLFVSSNHQPDLSWEGETNVIGGQEDERLGPMGSFEHGVIEAEGGPLRMPPRGNLELWFEPGQTENKFRRCGPSHFVAGVSILPGGTPMYTLEV